MPSSDPHIQAVLRWQKENQKAEKFRLHLNRDADLLQLLESANNKQGTIKQALRELRSRQYKDLKKGWNDIDPSLSVYVQQDGAIPYGKYRDEKVFPFLFKENTWHRISDLTVENIAAQNIVWKADDDKA